LYSRSRKHAQENYSHRLYYKKIRKDSQGRDYLFLRWDDHRNDVLTIERTLQGSNPFMDVHPKCVLLSKASFLNPYKTACSPLDKEYNNQVKSTANWITQQMPLLRKVSFYQAQANRAGWTGYRLYGTVENLKKYSEILGQKFGLYSRSRKHAQENYSHRLYYKKIRKDSQGHDYLFLRWDDHRNDVLTIEQSLIYSRHKKDQLSFENDDNNTNAQYQNTLK